MTFRDYSVLSLYITPCKLNFSVLEYELSFTDSLCSVATNTGKKNNIKFSNGDLLA